MVGKQPAVVLLAASLAWFATRIPAQAADTPPPSSTATSPAHKTGPNGKGQIQARTPSGPEFENVRNALNALTPEQLQRFQQNFIRWSNLSPEEKKLLRDRESVQRQKMLADAQAALASTGLQLSQERQMQFFKRYGEERRKIEESLRQEMEGLRKPRVEQLILQLKTEFTGTGP